MPNYSVLLVDDDPDIVTVFSRGLEGIGLKIHSFTDPKMALSFFKSNSQDIDLVISDIKMSGMSGFELASSLRAIKPEVKILLMTAYQIGGLEYNDAFPSLKIDEFLQKPILPKRMGSMIMRHLQTIEQR